MEKDRREIAKELYLKSGIDDKPYHWHIWKRAFDLGWAYNGKEKDVNIVNVINPTNKTK